MAQPLRNVVELLIEEAVPCSYQVVPEFLTREAAAYVQAARADHPGLVRLNQHGLRHEQTLDGEHRYSEFDGHRPYAEQRRDIEQGLTLLSDLLGSAFDRRVFTPPCHKYDDVTVQVLAELGFEVLSAGVKVDPVSRLYYRVGAALGRVSFLGKRVSYHGRRTPGTGLAELSVCIDVDEDVDARGEKIEKSLDDLWGELEACRARLSVVGVMLHHGKCEGRRVDVLREFVRRLKGDPGIEIRSLPEIVAGA